MPSGHARPSGRAPAVRGPTRGLRILCPVPDRLIPLPPLPSGLDTPGLVVFVDRVAANIDDLQRDLDARGIALRPHVKTHKSVRISRMQLDAGAAGLTVGTLGEAEVLASAGLRDLFLAYPLWAEGPKAARLRARPRVGRSRRSGSTRRTRSSGSAAAVAGDRRAAAGAGRGRTQAATGPASRRPGEAVEVASRGRARRARGGGRVHPRRAQLPARGRRCGRARRGGVARGGGRGPGGGGVRGADRERRLDADPDPGRRGPGDGDPRRDLRAGRSPAGRAGGDRRRRDRGGRRRDGRLGRPRPGGPRRRREGADEGPARVRRGVRRDPRLAGRGDRARCTTTTASCRWRAARRRRALGSVVAVVPNHICPVVDLVSTFAAVQADGRVEHWPVDARGRSG